MAEPSVLSAAAPGLEQAARELGLLVFDFDGVFTDNHVFVLEDGREAVRCSRLDGIGLSRLRKTGLHMAILSTEVNPVVSARAKKLKLDCRQGCEDKAAGIRELCEEFGVSLEKTAFVGNDVNDLPALSLVGLPLIVADAYPDVRGAASYITKTPGGEGAVREICDVLAALREAS